MSQIRQQLRLTFKGAAMLFGRGESLFDCDHAAQVLIHRLIDSTHASSPKLLDDATTTLQDSVGGLSFGLVPEE
jgi:hypothetical protein